MQKTLEQLSDDLISAAHQLGEVRTSEAPAIDLLVISVSLMDVLAEVQRHQKKIVEDSAREKNIAYNEEIQ